MRLSEEEQTAIIEIVFSYDSSAQVRLFGSRVDDSKRGGDIDLLVFSNIINFSQKVDILVDLKNRIGEQKIDLIIYPFGTSNSWLEEILKTSIQLR